MEDLRIVKRIRGREEKEVDSGDELWVDQSTSTTCSLACLCYAMRVILGVDKKEEDISINAVHRKRLKRKGLCLDDLAELATSNGLECSTVHVTSDACEAFRERCINVFRGTMPGPRVIVVNFHYWDEAEERGRSHFTCLRSLSNDGQRVRITDTRWQRADSWIRIDALVHSMNSPDNDVDANRGYLVLGPPQ